MDHKRLLRTIVFLTVALAVLLLAGSIALASQGRGRDPLEMYTATVSRAQLRELTRQAMTSPQCARRPAGWRWTSSCRRRNSPA